MAFFLSDNPIALFLALIVTVSLLKLYLEKQKMFEKKKSTYILPVLILAILVLVIFPQILQIISLSIPFFALLTLLLFGICSLMFMMGMKYDKIWPTIKKLGPVKTTIQILVFCIIAFAISHVYGEKLLQEKTVTLTDPLSPTQDTEKIDFSPLFTSQAMGMITLMTVLGFGFYFVNYAK